MTKKVLHLLIIKLSLFNFFLSVYVYNGQVWMSTEFGSVHLLESQFCYSLHLCFLVQVVIRVRPLNNTEKNLCGYNRCLRQESAQSITWTGHPELSFKFDHVACESVNQVCFRRI
jgi:hypothetical protein